MPHRIYIILVALILLASLGLRCGTAYWWQARLDPKQRFVFGDSESYWALAGHIARGEPYQYGSRDAKIFRVPVYPMLLAPFTSIYPEATAILAARLLGCVMGTFGVAGIMFLAHRCFGAITGLIAGVLAAFYPGGISMSIFVLSEAPFSMLMVVHLLIWQYAFETNVPKRAASLSIAAGVVAGLAVLTRPSWLLFTPFALGAQLCTKRTSRTALMAVAMAIGFVLTMAPWWFRNYQITGRFVLSTLQVGASMYDGLNPEATGGSDTGMAFTTSFIQEQKAADAKATLLESTFEYRLDRRMADAAADWALANPGQVLRLAANKIWRIWRPWPTAAEVPGTAIRLASAVGMLGIVVPAFIYLFGNRRLTWSVALLLLPTIYFTGLHAIFVGSIRYRIPAVFLLTVIAAAFWSQFLRLESRFAEEELD